MPTPALLLLAATVLPLAGFGVLLFLGRRMDNPLPGVVATVLLAGGFVCSAAATIAWLLGGNFAGGQPWGAGTAPIHLPFRWLPADTGGGGPNASSGSLDLGVYIDSLTVALFSTITFAASMAHVFGIGYTARDARAPRFFACLGLLCFSTLGLVLGGTLLHLLVFSELLALSTYLLIGFDADRNRGPTAALKAFFMIRLGGIGFLTGLAVLFGHLGNLTLPEVWRVLHPAALGESVVLPGGGTISAAQMTWIGVALFLGAVGLGAQFPLHLWPSDAAADAPAPAAAMIAAGATGAAGVYLLGRIFPILTPDAKLFIAIIGCTTLTAAGLIAAAQTDLRRAMAWLATCHLGYMMLAMGVGSWLGGLFYLVGYAAFQSLLLLGAGGVTWAARGESNLSQYGGLIRKLPITALTFLAAALSAAGAPLLSGYYSRRGILTDAGAFAALATAAGGSRLYWLLWLLPALTAGVVAFALARCFVLTFLGRPRNLRLYAGAREPWLLWLPLVFLALPSLFGGIVGVQTMLRNTFRETQAVAGGPDFRGFDTAWQGKFPGELGYKAPPRPAPRSAAPVPDVMVNDLQERGARLTTWVVTPGAALGIAAALLIYLRGYRPRPAGVPTSRAGWVREWLAGGMYFPEMYSHVFVATARAAAWAADWLDRRVLGGPSGPSGPSGRGRGR